MKQAYKRVHQVLKEHSGEIAILGIVIEILIAIL